jgi:peptidoglycan/LPS O-acetylase OafA/YrhL
MQRINKLDGLRGLFALFVVLFHFNINNAPAALVNNFFVRESFIFVDFFFILSGFVISLTYDNKLNTTKTIWHFIKKRFIRLYPLLLFSTLMYWYFVHPFLDKQNILLALDTLFLTNATPILGTGIGMNYPSWSISSEMISYIVFGLCSLISISKKKTTLIVILTIGCFAFLALQQNYFVTGSFGFVRGLACFNLGYLIHIITKKDFKIPNTLEWFITIGIIALMCLHFTVPRINPIYNIALQFLIPITFALSILIFIKTNGLISKVLQTKPFLFLGKISYSVYLNQALVIGFGIPKLYNWIQFVNGDMKKMICVLLILTSIIAYSTATQYFIENRIGKKLAGLIKH